MTSRLIRALTRLLRPAAALRPRPPATARTVAVPPPKKLSIEYDPRMDGDPDAGEIVWTWVPFAEEDGRGKDRPVLVFATAGPAHVFALRMTSSDRGGDSRYLALGSGDWDSSGRPSWLDLSTVYCVPVDAMRREACALDPQRFTRVAAELRSRYGWGS